MNINKEIIEMKTALAALEAKALLNTFKSESFWFQGFEYKTVQSPTTGRIWLDRNLGARLVDGDGGYFTFGEALCPDGYEVPSDEEWDAELPNDWKTDIEWMNLPLAGIRGTNGSFYARGGSAHLWSSTRSGGKAYRRLLVTSAATVYRDAANKAKGRSVRLIKKDNEL